MMFKAREKIGKKAKKSLRFTAYYAILYQSEIKVSPLRGREPYPRS